MSERHRELTRQGFVRLASALDPTLLGLLRGAVEDILSGPAHPDLLRDSRGSIRKITYPLALDERFFLAIAHPNVLAIALEMSPKPEELVLTWEDVLYKAPRVGEPVPVHQDLALQSLPGPVFSLGLYLEDADENPVWFLPGSHQLGPQTRSQVQALLAERPFEPVAAGAGDIVVHDALCVHYSEANTGSRPRTTWYLEFRTMGQLLADGRWPREWAESRRALLFHACAAREAAGLEVLWPPLGPGESRESWLGMERALRVPHVAFGVDFDLESPFFHFEA